MSEKVPSFTYLANIDAGGASIDIQSMLNSNDYYYDVTISAGFNAVVVGEITPASFPSAKFKGSIPNDRSNIRISYPATVKFRINTLDKMALTAESLDGVENDIPSQICIEAYSK